MMNFELIKEEIEDKDLRDYENCSDGIIHCWYRDPKGGR